MKLQNLNDWLSVLTNAGVIAGLVFIAMEYRQNNALLEVESSSNRANQVNEIVNIVIQDQSLIELMHKERSELAGVELDRLVLLGIRMILVFEEQYEASIAGHGSTLDRNLSIQKAIFHRPRLNYGTKIAWPVFKLRGETPFVRWFEEHVVQHSVTQKNTCNRRGLRYAV